MANWHWMSVGLIVLIALMVVFEPYLEVWLYRCKHCRCRVGDRWDESSEKYTVSKFHCGACGIIQTIRVTEHQ